MRVCVCGAQSLFMTGGAEQNLDNLVAALEDAGHDADLVRLPVVWSQSHLLRSAFAWRLLTIDADVVVAMNFPSYFVRHPRKVVWLNHQHRGAYDALDQPWSDIGLDDRSLSVHRDLVDWDTRVLAESAQLFTVSACVGERLRRYNGLDSRVLYHPPPLAERLHGGDFGDYLFTATRLEANKRPDLMIAAMQHVRTDVRLVIAGRGTMQAELESLVRRLHLRDRVTLAGFVDDHQLTELYAGARAVLYVPSDEDYGYVTLQAFCAAKPVVTTNDSGGVLEWVDDGVSGAIAEPTPESLAAAIDAVAGDTALCRRLGATGRERVARLSWDTVVATLLGG